MSSSSLARSSAAVYGVGVDRAWDRAREPADSIRRSRSPASPPGSPRSASRSSSPLDGLAEHSLTAHMVQHVLLIAVAAPLARRRRAVSRRARARRHAQPRAVAADALEYRRAAATPAVGAVDRRRARRARRAVVLWHLPGAYDAALHNHAVHAAEHACFFLTATVFWWGARRRPPIAGAAPAVLVLFVATLPANASRRCS